jgi:AcrR family transcriptional regulator
MTDQSRRYQMSRRADSQEQTRQRLVESAVTLHGTLGPARTSMSAVAAHAGVRRSTLYRHFPDETALFDACTAHWSAANPPPDPTVWAAIADPDARLRLALDQIYAYYGQTEQMLDNLFRDEATVPLIRERFAAFHGYLEMAAELLMEGRTLRGAARRRTRAAVGHAIAFSTWRSLVVEQRLGDADAAALARALVEVSAEPQA